MKKKNKKNICTSKIQSIQELIKKKNLNECFLCFTVPVLSTDMNVPQSH